MEISKTTNQKWQNELKVVEIQETWVTTWEYLSPRTTDMHTNTTWNFLEKKDQDKLITLGKETESVSHCISSM